MIIFLTIRFQRALLFSIILSEKEIAEPRESSVKTRTPGEDENVEGVVVVGCAALHDQTAGDYSIEGLQ